MAMHPFASQRKMVSVWQNERRMQAGFRDSLDALEWCQAVKLTGTVKIITEQAVFIFKSENENESENKSVNKSYSDGGKA